ncbi:MAG: PilZ domain-containing protein [Thermodesulfobacteriota bacterium]|nr:PilZ domain-containing protein [Thermodesulfobacteriota bacterium]
MMDVNVQRLNSNRREDIRINGFFPFQFRRITVEEFENQKRLLEMCKENKKNESNKMFFTPLVKNKKDFLPGSEVNPHLTNILIRIDQKLDLLLNYLIQGADFKELSLQEPREINISSSGVGFITDDILSMSDILEVKMIFPTSHFNIIKAFAKVTRIEKENSYSENPQFSIGAAFIHIDEEDRENIVRYVFKKQKESLRKRNSYKDFSSSS